MAKVTVYDFKKYDIETDQTVLSSRPATLEAITQIDEAVVLKETAQEVDASQIDENGFYNESSRFGTEEVV